MITLSKRQKSLLYYFISLGEDGFLNIKNLKQTSHSSRRIVDELISKFRINGKIAVSEKLYGENYTACSNRKKMRQDLFKAMYKYKEKLEVYLIEYETRKAIKNLEKKKARHRCCFKNTTYFCIKI